MKEVTSVESASKSSIDFRVRNKKSIKPITSITKTPAVCGLLSKLKNGPTIVKINPNIDEMKNLGNRRILSQKSDIWNRCETDID